MKKINELWRKFVSDVNADREALRRYRAAFHGDTENVEEENILSLMLKEPGVQPMAAIRLMRFARDSGIPKGGEVLSRLIRYMYGMEVNWQAEIDAGTVIENGPGLVVSCYSKIGPRCVLSQHVTLGVMRHPKTREHGAPTLENDVYVGPGAILLGPITIGAHARIMAGCVVTESVPPYGVVYPPESKSVVSRRKKG